MIILSILWVNKFQMISFCMLECANGQLEICILFSGICKIFRKSNRQLLILSHCCTLKLESFSTTCFMWSITALVLRLSVNASLLVANRRFSSNIVCLPTSVRETASIESKHSTGTVRLTNILIVVSIILEASLILVSSLT